MIKKYLIIEILLIESLLILIKLIRSRLLIKKEKEKLSIFY